MRVYYFVVLQTIVASFAASARGEVQQISPIKEKRKVDVDPDKQHIPLDPTLAHLRPPEPRGLGDEHTRPMIFIGLSSFRDGHRCGNTIYTALKAAQNPDRVSFGIVDQKTEDEISCVDAYCDIAKTKWSNDTAPFTCLHVERIRVDTRSSQSSRGPTLARFYQQQLIDDQEFCLQLDSHSVFTKDWDVNIVADWAQLKNEMAVLSTYIHHYNTRVDVETLAQLGPPDQLPHLCKTKRGGYGMVRNEGASMVHHSKLPQMSALWGAGLSFLKCHGERRVRVDPHTLWMFDGEEFLRASHLWTHGYDLYSPSKFGSVVYHNYTAVPKHFYREKVDEKVKQEEREMGNNRFRMIFGIPFKGKVNAMELDKYGFGTARTLAEYLEFSGVTFAPNTTDNDTCYQLHWVPYSDPSSVESLLPGWKMNPSKLNSSNLKGNFTGKNTSPNFYFFVIIILVIVMLNFFKNNQPWLKLVRYFRSKQEKLSNN